MDIVFGYSRLGKSVCDWLLSLGKKDIAFVDNSSKKVGEVYKNIPVREVSKMTHNAGGGGTLLAYFTMIASKSSFSKKA